MANKDKIKTILLIGAAGGLAEITIGLLAKYHPEVMIIGVDPRSARNILKFKNIKFFQIKYGRNTFENLFREYEFDGILHLARMGHVHRTNETNLAKRLDLNIIGTKNILDLALKYSVNRVVFLSTFHVYGAFPDNPAFMNEDMGLRASFKHPEIRDVVEMDQIVTNWMWKNQYQLETIVLRPTNIIGPNINNNMTKYLSTPYSPLPIDFNPMFQFIHEFDMAQVLLKSLYDLAPGVYNVSPEDALSLREAKRIMNRASIPLPIYLLEKTLKFLDTGIWKFPLYLLDYLKYSSLIDSKALCSQLPADTFHFTSKEALEFLGLGN